MDLKKIRYFLDVFSEGSFVRAAAKNRVTQPALSGAVQSLEREFGTALLSRGRGRPALTPAGQILYARGGQLLSDLQSIHDEIRDLGHEPAGSFRIIAGGTAALYILPALLGRYRKIYPKVRFSLVEGDSLEIRQNLTEAACDMAIVSMPVPAALGDRFVVQPFYEDELVVVTPAGYFGKSKSIPVSKLKAVPFIHFSKNSAIREFVDGRLGAAKIPLEVVMELRSISLIRKMVGEGVGVAILSRLAIGQSSAAPSQNLSIYTIRDVPLKRELAVVYPRNRYLAGVLENLRDDLLEIDD